MIAYVRMLFYFTEDNKQILLFAVEAHEAFPIVFNDGKDFMWFASD